MRVSTTVRQLAFSLKSPPACLRQSHFLPACQTGMRDAVDDLLSQLPLRLMLAMYSCEIQASGIIFVFICLCFLKSDLADVLGKVYAVVSRCRGKVVSEELREGTSYFVVNAQIPATESFGFADGKLISLHKDSPYFTHK